MNGTHEAHAMFVARHPYTPQQQPVTLLELANPIQWQLRHQLLARTKTIRVSRLEILDSRWMIAMRSLTATMMRQPATVVSEGNSRFDMSGPGSVASSRDVHAWIVASRVVVVACSMRPGRRRLVERPRFGTAEEDFVQ